MNFRTSLLPLVVSAGLGLWPALAAHAKFLSPPDVLQEPELTAIVATLKKVKSPEESRTAFASVSQLASAASSPERQFFLAYLLQYGLGTAVSVDQAREAYQKAADAGFAPAKNNLALLNLASGGDPAKAVSMVEELANTGNAAAQCSMGQLYMDGVPSASIPRDPDKARLWFGRAAAGGDSDAAWTLALILGSQPQPTAAHAKQAMALIEQAVQAGHLPALVEYGSRLVSGNGVAPDMARGLSLLQKAAGEGASQAIMTLGALYEAGTGVKKDPEKALAYYREAIANNEFSAYNKLGYFHENGIGVAKDELQALENYQLGAARQVGLCMFNLAVFHDEGKAGLKPDPAAAFLWHYKAAMAAFVPSQLALGTRYRDGKGTAPDAQAALAWYQRAMQNGDLTGALNVAAILENGSSGVVDLKTAGQIYKEAATKGNPLAMTSLGAMIEDGRGVQGDFKQVFLLYATGAEAKIEAAKERLANFKKRLSPEQLKEAEAFVLANHSTPSAGVPGAAPDQPPPPGRARPAEAAPKERK